MRLINANSLRAKMGNLAGFDVLGRCIDEESTVFDIPDNATNGDIIKALFPNATIHIFECLNSVNVITDETLNAQTFDLDWWNAPYQKGDQK